MVYAKKAFGGPKQVISYLGRYTHRTAISNDRVLEVNKNKVTFSWLDYKKDYAKQITTIPGEKFLHLFCQHILPPGFTRIRHYGFLSSASKTKSLKIIRKALKVTTKSSKEEDIIDTIFNKMGIQPGICKSCGGKMVVVEIIPNCFRKKQRAPPYNKGGILKHPGITNKS